LFSDSAIKQSDKDQPATDVASDVLA